MDTFFLKRLCLSVLVLAAVVGVVWLFSDNSFEKSIEDSLPAIMIKKTLHHENEGIVSSELHSDGNGRASELHVKFADGVECVAYYDDTGVVSKVKELGRVLVRTKDKLLESNSGILYTLKPFKGELSTVQAFHDNGQLMEEVRFNNDGSAKASRYESSGKQLQAVVLNRDGSSETTDFAEDGVTKIMVFKHFSDGRREVFWYNEQGVLRCVGKRNAKNDPVQTGTISYFREDGKTLWFTADKVDVILSYKVSINTFYRHYSVYGGPLVSINELYPDGKTFREYRPLLGKLDGVKNAAIGRISSEYGVDGKLKERISTGIYLSKTVETFDASGKLLEQKTSEDAWSYGEEMNAFLSYLVEREVVSVLTDSPLQPIELDLHRVKKILALSSQ